MSRKNILHVPTSTYRLQFNHTFKFSHANRLTSYFKALGISDLYASPLTLAKSGSMHGYDVTNSNQLNREIGSLKKFKQLCRSLHNNNLSILLDIVPNHMSASKENPWWNDILKNGKKSNFSNYFDIDWSEHKHLSYRRFFDINELACLRMENITVFNDFHRLVIRLIKSNCIMGLRIDHIDGLFDPVKYLNRINRCIHTIKNKYPYLIVEKILALDEDIPIDWPVMGTTGYDFLNRLNAIFVHPLGHKLLQHHYEKNSKNDDSWQELSYLDKKYVIQHLFFNETTHLAQLLLQMKIFKFLQYDRADVTQAIAELTANLPIYRTYIDKPDIEIQDKKYLKISFKKTLKNAENLKQKMIITEIEKNIFHLKKLPKKIRTAWISWVKHWQQYTGPIMAKGFEDTTCYQYNPLISLNEVGSSPSIVDYLGNNLDFHTFLSKRQLQFPYTLNCSSTHDTKRSEDVRARINVLTEFPNEWLSLVRRWRRQTRALKIKVGDASVPEPNLEIFIYQTLLGVWPLQKIKNHGSFVNRLKNIFVKVARENKAYTSWQQPNEAYEQGLSLYIHNLLDNKNKRLFLSEFLNFQKKIAFYGMINSLSQLLIKLTAPGIPDIYQGCEEWNFTLVDPDNRSSINFAKIKHKLQTLQNHKNKNFITFLSRMLRFWPNGHIKIYTTECALNFRRQHHQLFTHGCYIPLTVHGSKRKCVFSYARVFENQFAIIIVLKYASKLTNRLKLPLKMVNWGSTFIKLPKNFPISFLNIFTQQDHLVEFRKDAMLITLRDIFNQFPVALFFNDERNDKNL